MSPRPPLPRKVGGGVMTPQLLWERRPCRLVHSNYFCITQLTLSLYLTTQCQLKLRHSVASLAQTLDYIEVAQRRLPADRTQDKLTSKLIERKVIVYTITSA